MSLEEKALEVKKLIELVCQTIPILVSIIKEIIIVVRDLKVG